MSDLTTGPVSLRQHIRSRGAVPALSGWRSRVGDDCVSLSLRDVEPILAARGVVVSYESIREWGLRFGRRFANVLDIPVRPKPPKREHSARAMKDQRALNVAVLNEGGKRA